MTAVFFERGGEAKAPYLRENPGNFNLIIAALL